MKSIAVQLMHGLPAVGRCNEVLLVFSDLSKIYISAPLHNVMMVPCLKRLLRAFRTASGVTLL